MKRKTIEQSEQDIRSYIKFTEKEAFYLWEKVTDEPEMTRFLNGIVNKLWRRFGGDKSEFYKMWARRGKVKI